MCECDLFLLGIAVQLLSLEMLLSKSIPQRTSCAVQFVIPLDHCSIHALKRFSVG